MNPFSALTSKIFAGAAVLLLVLLLGSCIQTAGLKSKVAKLEATVTTLRVDLRQCQANRATLESAVASQNAAVGVLKAEGDRRSRAAEKAVRDARAVAESERRRADRALAAKPKTCADLSAVLERSLP